MPKQVTGLAAPLPLANVDTDVIMPKRFLITITREGLADGTFADLRFDDAGDIRPEFILNRKPWNVATILVVGDNFGCGSSREHAVWGLSQLGITAVIGTGFAGIFYDNARKNGLALPIVTADERDRLLELAQQGIEVAVDIENCVITAGKFSTPFQMDAATQMALIEGRDDILDSLEYSEAIRGYEEAFGEKMKVSVLK
ncbi:3-isopropylmalate dehydratase small subunit [Sulfitobacter sp.]|uniref:3-isopropylmalate dehydratase small subunit n=1 Tax=Sulfitobacter sp. TaxID=1903071 RepID=UPI003001E906